MELDADNNNNSSSNSNEEMAHDEQQWRGAVEARLPSTPAAAAWARVADFFALHRYLPTISICERVAVPDGDDDDDDAVGGGVRIRPGCVRYCASFAPGTVEVSTWAREELVELDPRARRLAYAVVENNMGLARYVASMTVLPAGEGEAAAAGGGGGCRLVWAFECDPVQGFGRDALLGYLDGAVKGLAARIEEEAAAAVPVAA